MPTILPLFSAPVYTSDVGHILSQEKDYVRGLEYEMVKANNGLMSVNTQLLDAPELKNLRESVDANVNEYVYNVLKVKKHIVFKCITSWAMKHEDGHRAQEHLHSNAVISGVVYIDAPENSGNLVFQKSLHSNNLFTPNVKPDIEEYNIWNCEEWTVVPENNLIALFPATLVHFVTPNNSGKTRYCIAFNYFPYGVFCHKESQLVLNP